MSAWLYRIAYILPASRPYSLGKEKGGGNSSGGEFEGAPGTGFADELVHISNLAVNKHTVDHPGQVSPCCVGSSLVLCSSPATGNRLSTLVYTPVLVLTEAESGLFCGERCPARRKRCSHGSARALKPLRVQTQPIARVYARPFIGAKAAVSCLFPFAHWPCLAFPGLAWRCLAHGLLLRVKTCNVGKRLASVPCS